MKIRRSGAVWTMAGIVLLSGVAMGAGGASATARGAAGRAGRGAAVLPPAGPVRGRGCGHGVSVKGFYFALTGSPRTLKLQLLALPTP